MENNKSVLVGFIVGLVTAYAFFTLSKTFFGHSSPVELIESSDGKDLFIGDCGISLSSYNDDFSCLSRQIVIWVDPQDFSETVSSVEGYMEKNKYNYSRTFSSFDSNTLYFDFPDSSQLAGVTIAIKK